MMSYSDQDLSAIRQVKIFSDLSSSELNELLKNSRISSYKKGKNLFLAEEEARNLYLLLEGAVEIFVIDEDGKKIILRMVEGEEILNDVFLNQFRASSKARSSVRVLVLPLTQVREFLKKNLQFGLNFLSEFAAMNAELLDQLARLKCANSKEKLGQFLIEKAFEKTAKKSKNIELKFDKGSLASYLGVNAETLSRSLRKLKDDGEILVKKNTITLLKPSSLCCYCNNKIAAKCDLTHADFCTQK